MYPARRCASMANDHGRHGSTLPQRRWFRAAKPAKAKYAVKSGSPRPSFALFVAVDAGAGLRSGRERAIPMPTLLKFRADHAAAKEAVMSEVQRETLDRLGFCRGAARLRDKALSPGLTPDARCRKKPSRQSARSCPKARAASGDSRRRTVRRGDQCECRTTLQAALSHELSARGIDESAALSTCRARKIMDEVARLIECGISDFSSAGSDQDWFRRQPFCHYIYRPATEQTDADREVISNINRGLSPAQAAAQIADRSSAFCATKVGCNPSDKGQRRWRRFFFARKATSPVGAGPLQQVADPPRSSLFARWDSRSGIYYCTSDDALYVALDEGTKVADADVVYAVV